MKPIRSFQNRGLALVIVLIMLMLLSGLLVAFLGRVGSERVASKSLAQSFEAKQAYDTAVNVVMSQIREGTRSSNGTRAWASQPGAIWSFGDVSSGDQVYKLYSSDNMKMLASAYNITVSSSAATESGYIPGTPLVTPPGFVDLNDPMLVPIPGEENLVEAHYPIVNPYAARNADGTPLTAGVNPAGGIVKGFVANAVVHPSKKKTRFGNGAPVDVLSLPMRVKWLYQLKDGTLAAMNASGIIPGASKDNPPIARIAFWTDDEGGKINVNTAGENTYWDTPDATTRYESGDGLVGDTAVSMGPDVPYGNVPGNGVGDVRFGSLALGISQPAAREWQRFPGHPATTSLSPVLRWLATDQTNGKTADLKFKEAIYRLSPRLMGGPGTSRGGTYNIYFDQGKPDPRVPKRDRLFPTLDEYWFRPDRSGLDGIGLYPVFRNEAGGMEPDPQFIKDLKLMTPDAIERLRFFLTANSRAPELTLLGTPRISMWPVNDLVTGGAKRTAYDDLLAYCATIAGKSYYFARKDPWNTRYDLEKANQGRNLELLDGYLRKLADKNVPGTGRSFAVKYSTPIVAPYKAIDQILLSMFDYVRSTNLVDSSKDPASSSNVYPYAYTPSYSGTGEYDPKVTKPNPGSGQVVPTVRYKDKSQGQDINSGKEPSIKGFGRFVTLSESALLVYRDNEDPIPSWDPPKPAGTLNQDYLQLRVMLVSEMFTPSPGYPAMAEAYAYGVKETGTTKMGLTDPDVGEIHELHLADDAPSLINYVEVDPSRVGYGRFFSPTRGINQQFVYDAATPEVWGFATAKNMRYNKLQSIGGQQGYAYYPFFSKMIYLKKNSKGGLPTSFTIKPGSLTYEFYPLNPPAGNTKSLANTEQVIQRIKVDFPETTVSVMPTDTRSVADRLKLETLMKKTGTKGTGDKDDMDIIGAQGNRNQSVVRSLEASGARVKGDLRLIAGSAVIPQPQQNADSYFSLTADKDGKTYKSDTPARIENFRSGWGRHEVQNYPVRLVIGANERNDRQAKWPKILTTGVSTPSAPGVVGDFDRGLPKWAEGAYINKPDEGNVKNGEEGNGRSIPYFLGNEGYEEVGRTFFSPNRLVSSPVMFGSLPSGIYDGRPWETLLFCPPLVATHKGWEEPKDHYLLDWFTMPVVEPYAISEPLSTAGKINLNCRLAPFGYVKIGAGPNATGYIERTTGIHAVLKDIKVSAIGKDGDEGLHKDAPTATTVTRFDINPYDTVKLINSRLDTRGFFRSASEICELDLPMSNVSGEAVLSLPVGKTTMDLNDRQPYWNALKTMTGDNQRERPYSLIYPRLTTKSNVFTVHIYAQSLTKHPSTADSDWGKWDETKDRVTSEYRGSTMIERYIDLNDPALLGTLPGTQPYDAVKAMLGASFDFERYYRFRILNSKRFVAQ